MTAQSNPSAATPPGEALDLNVHAMVGILSAQQAMTPSAPSADVSAAMSPGAQREMTDSLARVTTSLGDAVARSRRRESAELKKRREAVDHAIEDAAVTREEVALDRQLTEVELAGSDAVLEIDEPAPAEVKAEVVQAAEADAAKARAAYHESFQVDTRSKAAWAARKVRDAKDRFEASKEIMKAEVRRRDAEYRRRREFFEGKLLRWALTQERDTKFAVRLPEGGVRLELRPTTEGGVRILDEKEACAGLLDQLGLLQCLEAGLVRPSYELVVAKTRAYVAEHPDLRVPGIVVEPEVPSTKLVIVRL